MNNQVKIAEGSPADPFVERIVYEACPLCGASEISEDRVADCSRHPSWKPPLSPELTWMECDDCGHSFTNGYYTEAALGLVFERIQSNQRPGEAVEKNRALSAAIVEKVAGLRRSGTWLDVGFGNGALLTTAQEFGFDVKGLDLREEAVALLQALGFEAHCRDICDAAELGPVDIISMADVLEHTPFPKKVLQAAQGMLSDGGVLFLSMPNADAFLWRNMTDQAVNPYWGEMEHYHNFGRRTLYRTLEETGFEPISYGISTRYRCGMEVLAQKRA